MKHASSAFTLCSILSIAACAVSNAASPAASPDIVGSGPVAPRDGPHSFKLVPSVMITTRDGVRLSTDLYRPDGPGPFPIILIRTPYDKNPYRMTHAAAGSPSGRGSAVSRFFASQGFLVAVQDMRGKWESEGRFTVFGTERQDFIDTVNWLISQPWADGNVGTFGCSYLGETQIVQSATRHANLKAAIPQAAAGGAGSMAGRYRYFAARNGGAYELGMGLGWFSQDGSAISLKPPAWLAPDDWARVSHLFSLGPKLPADFDFRRDVASLPLAGLLDRLGFAPTDWDAFVSNPPGAEYWKGRDYVRDGETIDVPALHVNSWYDFGAGDTIHQFLYFQRHAASRAAAQSQYLILGGGLHCTNEWVDGHTVVGERDIGDPRIDLWSIYLAWFNRWLRGDTHALDHVPRVHYYLLGRNEWRTADSFPVAGTREVKYYLQSERGANSLRGDGALTTGAPRSIGRDTFTYDPGNPVPSLGGPLCCIDSADQPEGAFDQSKIEARNDVLVYSTPPLPDGVTVVGPVKLVLHVSSSAKDTDFTGKILDVYPDGRAFNLQEGILRARYREGQDREVFMEPDGTYRIEIDLQAVGNWFAPGHRIRLEVSSSNFPRWDRNLNTGGRNFDESKWVPAQNVVHFGGRTPSHLLLPVVSEGKGRK
jgi:hypothetical protein